MKKFVYVLVGICLAAGITTGCTERIAQSLSQGAETEKTEVGKAEPEKEVSEAKQENPETEEVTDVEEDARILYDYSYKDALALAGVSSETIKVKQQDNTTTYTFTEHVLSCGTHMNGEIVEVVEGDFKTLTGSFVVTNNTYEINDLQLNIIFNNNTDEKTGYIKVNGKEVDINSNFTWQ